MTTDDLFPASASDDPVKRSPLLPMRHQADFFVADIVDAAFKADQTSMEHPVFSLSKKRDMTIRRYENGDRWMEVRPSGTGMATVFDRDILIYCISQISAAMNSGRPVSQTVRLQAFDLLVATNRDTSGRGYAGLADAMSRLRGTEIVTNIPIGDRVTLDGRGLIESYKIVRENKDNGRMLEIEIKLSDWVYKAATSQDVLTLNRRYFQLAKPLERRLYEIARKHVGQQSEFRIGIEKLQAKCGSQSTSKEFRRLLETIIETDIEHDHMPDYRFEVNGNMVTVRPKGGASTPNFPGLFLRLRTESYDRARELAPGWDVYVLEAEWREWVTKKKITPKSPNAHFQAFCKRRGPYSG